MSAQAPQQADWATKDVPLAAIESELERLWQRAQAQLTPDGAKGGDGISAVARARVLNFVAYARDPELARHVLEQVEHLAALHPSRTIVVLANEEAAGETLSATVSTHAQTTEDGRRVLHERVEIEAHGPVAESLPSIVVPLLLPDLPTYLWWPGDLPVGHAFWRRMVDACDRLIVNSGDFADPLDGMARFAEFYRGARRFHTFGDLNWHRLTQWRELIAQFFDNQAYRPYLDHIDEVVIEYAPGDANGKQSPANPAGALLLAGWLCSRLGWESAGCKVEHGALHYALVGWPSGRALSLVVRQTSAASEPGRIDQVRISATGAGQTAVFGLRRDDGSQVAHATATVGSVAGAPRTVSMVQMLLPSLLATELRGATQDETYEETLAVAGLLARQARGRQTTR